MEGKPFFTCTSICLRGGHLSSLPVSVIQATRDKVGISNKVMRRLSVIVILALLFTGSCRSWFNKSAANTETANANSGENPYANITDANEALAKGKELLDADDTQ